MSDESGDSVQLSHIVPLYPFSRTDLLICCRAFVLRQEFVNGVDESVDIRLRNVGISSARQCFLPMDFIRIATVENAGHSWCYSIEFRTQLETRTIREASVEYIKIKLLLHSQFVGFLQSPCSFNRVVFLG